MISRILVSVGVVAASVGFLVYGMGTSFVHTDTWMKNLGIILMVSGGVAAIVGGFWYRALERAATTRSAVSPRTDR